MKPNVPGRVWLMFILVPGWAGTARAQDNAAAVNPEDLRVVLQEGYRTARDLLDDALVVFQQKEESDPQWLRSQGLNEKEPVHYTLEYYLRKDGCERYAYLHYGLQPSDETTIAAAESRGAQGSTAFAVFDGHYKLIYYPTGGTYDTETQRGRAVFSESKTDLLTGGTGPVKFLGFAVGALPDDVLASPEVKIHTQGEQIEGLPAFQVSAPLTINKVTYTVTYWLCPGRTCLPLRMELRAADGTLLKRMDTGEFLKLPDGRWAIQSVAQRDFTIRDGKPWEIGVDTYTLVKLQLHPLVDEDRVFNTHPDALPTGALIVDNVAALEYTAGEGPVSDERVQQLVERTLDAIPESAADSGGGGASTQAGGPGPEQPLFSDAGWRTAASTGPYGSRHSTRSAAAAASVCLAALAGTAWWIHCRRRTGKQEKTDDPCIP
jgi:hypothetical protein